MALEGEWAPQRKNQYPDLLREIPATSADCQPCLHRFQGLCEGMARNFMDNYMYEEIHYQTYDKAQDGAGCGIRWNRFFIIAFPSAQHRRTANYQSPPCRQHWSKCRRGRKSWCPGSPTGFNHRKVQNGDLSWQVESDKKQPRRRSKYDRSK